VNISPELAQYINGCDSFPDGMFGVSWKHCCDVHDVAYSIGGSVSARLAADIDLGLCVAKVAGPIGIVMFIGVAGFGWLFFRYDGLPGRKNIWDLMKDKVKKK